MAMTTMAMIMLAMTIVSAMMVIRHRPQARATLDPMCAAQHVTPQWVDDLAQIKSLGALADLAAMKRPHVMIADQCVCVYVTRIHTLRVYMCMLFLLVVACGPWRCPVCSRTHVPHELL